MNAAPHLLHTGALDGMRAAERRHVDQFGEAALTLRDQVCRRARVELADLTGPGQSGAALKARQDLAYRLWTECRHLTLHHVARLIGRRDHSAAIHAILAGARARGIMAARVSDLRENHGDPVDWTKLAFAAAGARESRGLTLERAAKRARVTRTEWRKAEQGRALSAGSLLRICRALAIDPLSLLGADDREESP